MFNKFFKLIALNSESFFVYYILPTIISVSGIILIWLILLILAKFIKIKAEKWENRLTQKNLIQRQIVIHKDLIRKSLTSLRWILTLYILFMLASHTLEIFSSQIKDSIKNSALQSTQVWTTIAKYTGKSGAFFDTMANAMLNIFLIVLIAAWCRQILQKMLSICLHAADKNKQNIEPHRGHAKRHSLNSVTNQLLNIAISVIAIFTILQNLGINIAALLATAGLASVAIGFGAQSLVRDFISGFFILLEDQFAVGDTIELNTTSTTFSGTVEKITLRVAKIRSSEGSLVTIPNGDIRAVKNFTTDWSRIDFKCGISIKSDVEKASFIFNEEVQSLCKDFATEIMGAPDIRPTEKIVDFDNRTVVNFRVFIKTTSVATKVKIEMEFNKRLIRRFNAEGIMN